MDLVRYLLMSRTPLELAKELAATAKENVRLKDRVGQLEHEVFWMKAAERSSHDPETQDRLA